MLRNIVISLALVAILSSQAFGQGCNAVIIGQQSVPDFAESLSVRLGPMGGSVIHYFPPQVVIGFVPGNMASLLLLDPIIDTVCFTRVNPDAFSIPSSSKSGLGAWNYYLDLQEGLIQPQAPTAPPTPLANDNRFQRGSYSEASNADGLCFFGPASVSAWDKYTSVYMIGKIAVGIFLLESNGPAENWTAGEEQTVVNEILESTNRLSAMAKSVGVNLTWVYEFHFKVPTAFEPIQGNSKPSYSFPAGWDFAWVGDALASVGFNTNWCGYYDYVNNLRARSKTDWAYGVFVVRDQNDGDHRFANGDFAYAFDNSLIVMTYNNDNWRPENMNIVFQHETAHAFGAADEYQAGCGSGDCFNPYGYLGIANGNCVSCNPNPVDCVMRSVDPTITDYCFFTRGQIGWRDSDGDGPNDPIDPNVGHWATVFPVQPGTYVRISNATANGAFLRGIGVTSDNVGTSGSFVLWDCAQLRYIDDAYVAKWGSSNELNLLIHDANPSIIPVISGFQKTPDQKLNWMLSNSFAYVRCRILNSSGVEVLNPIFDKMFASGQIYQTDLRPLPVGTNYRADFLAWRPDGTNFTTSFTFNRDPLPVNAPTITASQTNTITVNWTDNNSWEDGYTVERKDATSSWTQIALLPKNSASCGDTPPLGSETYTYRVKAFNVDVSAYSNEVTITTKPKPPANFSANVVKVTLSPQQKNIPTNKVILSWATPINQKVPIDSYRVEAYYYKSRTIICQCWGCIPNENFWPTLDKTHSVPASRTADTLCLQFTDTLYDFYVKSFVTLPGSVKDSSLVWIKQQCPPESTLVGPATGVLTGSYCLCGPCGPDPEPNLNGFAGGGGGEQSRIGGNPLPQTFELEQNYPNPFNPSTIIRYALPQAAKVELKIYNILGQVVRRLVDEEQAAGFYEKLWDGRDQSGKPVSTGIYLYRIRAGDFVQTKKMQLIK